MVMFHLVPLLFSSKIQFSFGGGVELLTENPQKLQGTYLPKHASNNVKLIEKT